MEPGTEQQPPPMIKIAVNGCAHGSLDQLYDVIIKSDKQTHTKTQLLICCGDFQSVRNEQDLQCVSMPPKYKSMNSFYKYYSGEVMAPVLTIFVGGNHEASNYLQELEYGGWVAPNMYYLGKAGVINVFGLRIAGFSGIYKQGDYFKGRGETVPYNNNDIRSIYHVRQSEIFRLQQIQQPLDIIISHDWPQGIAAHGDSHNLVRKKPFLKDELTTLGNPAGMELLRHLKPRYWFSGHMHVDFEAQVKHEAGSITPWTYFVATSKPVPKHTFIKFLDVAVGQVADAMIRPDTEWLAIVAKTLQLDTPIHGFVQMPPAVNLTDAQLRQVHQYLSDKTHDQSQFVRTGPAYAGANIFHASQPRYLTQNPQTQTIKSWLNDITAVISSDTASSDADKKKRSAEDANLVQVEALDSNQNHNPDEIALDDDVLFQTTTTATSSASRNPDEIELE